MTPEEFWAILHAVPEEITTVRRLYYNDSGEPLFYSTEVLPGNYIDIDQETFNLANSKVRVQDGRLVATATHRVSKKLVPAEQGTSCDPRDVCVVVTKEQPHTNWTIKIYEQS